MVFTNQRRLSAMITSTITAIFGKLILMTLLDYISVLMRPKIGGSAWHDMLLRERGGVRPDRGEVREKKDMWEREKERN